MSSDLSDDERKGLLNLEDSELNGYDADNARTLRQPKKTSYEDAIAATGYGPFQYRLLALCGWALSSDAIEILGISFILPPATCDLHLSNTDKGWINSAIFLGMMIGGYMWGTLADLKGRRAVLLWSLSINAIGGLASSFAQSYWLFVLLRIVSGIGVGGSMPVIFAYYTEFQSKEKRGAMISMLATFWMCGNILAAALAWIVIPRSFSVRTDDFQYNTWRLYLSLCVVPSFTSALLFILMPESPKFLMENGKEMEALRVLERVYKSNGNHSGSYNVLELETSCSVKARGNTRGWFTHHFRSVGTNTAALFKGSMLSITLIMVIIYFTLSFGYYGLFMWFPELFQRIELYGGSACHPGNMTGNASHTNQSVCTVTSTVYLESFLTAVSNLPGNIFTILVIDRVGRKPLLAGSMVISGLCVFFVWLVKTKLHNIILSCIFSGFSVIGFNVLDVLGAELFPTTLRTTANGMLAVVSRIAAILGNQAFGRLVTTNCAIPMILVAVLLSIGGLCSFKLPNTTKRDLL